ncbi:MAG TPA: hypothetical protein VF118_05495 [Gemmatimonadaceae bacterium]
MMGGQACVLYGGAEFSRDADLAVLADAENLRRLANAFTALVASVEYVPPFEAQYLERGHAVHFRCGREDVRGLRVDVMSKMRGVDSFATLWERRTTLTMGETPDKLEMDVLALPDLVRAKKTQRDKDWPMIRRLLEANYFAFRTDPTGPRIDFWLRELRSPELLVECARTFPGVARAVSRERAAVMAALGDMPGKVEDELRSEENRERAADRAYWAPLRKELEQLRRAQGERAPD